MDQKILYLFTKNSELSFNQIEKQLKIRSNKLSYHLQKLVSSKILEKANSKYKLSAENEYLIPYISDKKAAIPVVMIKIGKSNSIFLVKREKRPYKDKLGLPGGRLILGESIEMAAKRIMKAKFNIDIQNPKIDKLALEHIKKSNKILHSFILILVKASTKQDIQYYNFNKVKNKIIKSDYTLLKDSSSSILPTIISKI